MKRAYRRYTAAALAMVMVVTACTASRVQLPSQGAGTAPPGAGTPPAPTGNVTSPLATPSPTASVDCSTYYALYPATGSPAATEPVRTDPVLEDMIPSQIDCVDIWKMSMAGTWSGGGGDVCMFFCPGEPQYFGAALGLTTLDGTYAVAAGAANRPSFGVLIFGFRVPGSKTDDLIPAWIMAEYRYHADPVCGNCPTAPPITPPPTPTLKPLVTRSASIGGKQVTILEDQYREPYIDSRAIQYLYATRDVLFIVEASSGPFDFDTGKLIFDPADASHPPQAFIDTIAALP